MLRKFNFIWGALLTIILFIVSINNYIGNTDLTIQADGIGYYDYLPATFIYHDLYRINDSSGKLNARVSQQKGAYVETENGNWVNKYAPGAAVLQLPYQKSVFYAALFYLFLALVFIHLLLKTYAIPSWIIVFLQLLLALATGVTHYANVEASFSHVYSLFAITAFLYFARKFFIERQYPFFLWASFFFGLILILRPVNGIILAAVPFIAGTFDQVREGFKYLYKKYLVALAGLFIVLLFAGFLSLVWYMQCEQWVLNTYQNEEGFYFLNPQIFNILFSYKKGLFVYTPVLLLAFLALFTWIKNRQFLPYLLG